MDTIKIAFHSLGEIENGKFFLRTINGVLSPDVYEKIKVEYNGVVVKNTSLDATDATAFFPKSEKVFRLFP